MRTHEPLSASLLVPETEERHALRTAVRGLARSYGRAYFQSVCSAGGFPDELWNALGSAGFLGVHIPEEHGGGGGGLADLVVVMEETAAAGCPLQMIVISPTIAGSILSHHATEAMRREWLPGIASGRRKVAFAITEPDAGTNTHRISTTATPDGAGGWSISGSKHWTSGLDEADALIVVARDAGASADGRAALSMFLVPIPSRGLSFTPIDSIVRGAERQFVTFFDSVPVTAESLIGASGAGLAQVFAGLNPERVAAAALAGGISLFALERATDYARDRVVWSSPIGAHQGVAHPLAKAYIDVQLARLMNARAAEMIDSGLDGGEGANIAKIASADACLAALDQAIQVHGGNGLATEYGLADLWGIARMLKTAPVSREMVLNYVAVHSLGLPKSY